MDHDNSLQELIECPVCFEEMGPPLYQCTKGHLLCSDCKPKVKKCPVCRTNMNLAEPIRCLAVEKMIRNYKYLCRYNRFGCHSKMLWQDKRKHEENCEHRPFPCPEQCSIEGTAKSVVSHLQDKHCIGMLQGPAINVKFIQSCCVRPSWRVLFSAYGEYFCLFASLTKDNNYKFSVRYFGPKQNPFMYTLKVGGHERTFSFTGPVMSLRWRAEEVEDANDCLVVSKNLIYFFSEKGDIELSGKIENDRPRKKQEKAVPQKTTWW